MPVKKSKAGQLKTMEELEEKYRGRDRQRHALRIEAQRRFDNGEWESEIRPLWVTPCGDDEEGVSKAWETLRFLYFTGEMPDVLRKIIERDLFNGEFERPPGYDRRHPLPLFGLLENTSFPTEPWTMHREIFGKSEAEQYNQKAGLKNLAPLELLHPLDADVSTWIQKVREDDLAASRESFRKAIWARVSDESKVLADGDKRRVILEIDLSAENERLAAHFEKLISKLRGGPGKKRIAGRRPAAEGFFKGLAQLYRLRVPGTKIRDATDGLYTIKDGSSSNPHAITSRRATTNDLIRFKAQLEAEARIISGATDELPELK